MKYRKKPIVIEAFKWTGDIDQEDDPVWAVDAIRSGVLSFVNSGTPNVEMVVRTLEDGRLRQAKHFASPGDWIIRGIKGELYPCKPEIFEATYEFVEP